MLIVITYTIYKLVISVNLFESISLVSLIVVIGLYLFQQEVKRRRRAEFILTQQAKRERLIHQITHQIRLSLNIEEVLNTTVTEVRKFLEADRVLIFRIWDNGTGSAITENVRKPYPEILGETFPEEVFPQEYHQAYIKGKTRAINDINQTDVEDCLAEFVKQFGVKAKLVVPIIQETRNKNLTLTPFLWGLLIAHQCNKPRIWETEEIELMKQLATQVAIAIQQSELHTQLQKAFEREKELNIIKTRFFAMASHEFRTPLSTVLAAAQVLENAAHNSDNPEKQLRNLHRIQNSVKNMVQLLDDILTINRAETGNLEFNPKPIALEKFCHQFIEEIKLSTGTQHQLKFICEGTQIEPCLDEKLLRSILANLLSNAIKYSPQDSEIYLYLTFNLDHIEIQVKDFGLGISQEDQTEIFEPFYRGQNVHHLTGTGLGLVVVKKCVDLHDGSITINSEIGKGTTVKIILPFL